MDERAADSTVTGRDDPPTVTVPTTADGLATALTYAGARTTETGPARSHPDCRPHPPLVAFGEESVPEGLVASRPETEAALTLPADRATMFVAAPLAYYLGARVEVEDGATPTLDLPGWSHAFEPLPAFQHEVAGLLCDTFFLDGVVRERPDEGVDCREDLVVDAGCCPYALTEATPGERVARYLDCDRDRCSGDA